MYCSLGELTTGTPEQRQGKGAAKSWGQWKYKRQKHRYQHACFCLATMLTSKIIAEIIEKKNILNFLGARIAAKICFNAILINHDITYDTPMKRHLCPRCPPFEREEGTISPLSGVPG